MGSDAEAAEALPCEGRSSGFKFRPTHQCSLKIAYENQNGRVGVTVACVGHGGAMLNRVTDEETFDSSAEYILERWRNGIAAVC